MVRNGRACSEARNARRKRKYDTDVLSRTAICWHAPGRKVGGSANVIVIKMGESDDIVVAVCIVKIVAKLSK